MMPGGVSHREVVAGALTSVGLGEATPVAGEIGRSAAEGGMAWLLLDNGASVGQRGSENGIILRDEEHDLGARITLERGADHAPFAITCGIYGWMFHTRLFGTEAEAVAEFERMKEGLAAILEIIPCVDDPQAEPKSRQVSEAISSFVEQFP